MIKPSTNLEDDIAMTAKQEKEVELVGHLLGALSVSSFNLMSEQPPKPDVRAEINGHCIGIEVTEFHGDEGQNSNRGSIQRSKEVQISMQASGKPYVMPINVSPLPGLVARIGDKVKKSKKYQMQAFDELWLLISASLPQLGAISSTFIIPIEQIDDLNKATHEILCNSQFDKAYLHVLMGQCLYGWSPSEKWRVLQAPVNESRDPGLSRFKEILRDQEWLRDPVGKGHAEAMKALDELRKKKSVRANIQDGTQPIRASGCCVATRSKA